MSYLALSKRAACYLARSTGRRASEDVLAYAIEILFLNLLSVGVALSLAFWAGALWETLFSMGTVAIIRFFAGGAHSKSAVRCTIVTGIIFPTMGLTTQRIVALDPAVSAWLSVAALLLGITAVVAFAPVDSPAAPIISKQRRGRLKAGSIITVAALTVVALAVVNGSLKISVSLGILWSAFILTPAACRVFYFIDSVNLRGRGGVH